MIAKYFIFKCTAEALLLILICFLASPSFAQSKHITQEELSKLVSAAWKSYPQSYDVTLVKEIRSRPLDEDLVRREVERSYSLSDDHAVNRSGDGRAQEMEAEIDRILAEQQRSRILKQRIRIDGYRYRLDQQVVRVDGNNGGRTDHRAFVNAGNPVEGDFSHFEYDYGAETASLYSERQMWERHDPLEHRGLPHVVRTIVRGMLGKQVETAQGLHFSVDPDKINRAAEGDPESIRVDESDGNASGLVKLRIFLPVAEHAIFEIVANKDDYSQVHSFKAYSPSDGHLMEERVASAFDQKGIPHNVTKKRWDVNGDLVEMEQIAINSVELNPDIERHVFQFDPPQGFWIVDRRADAPIALPPSVFQEPELPESLVDLKQPQQNRSIPEHSLGEKTSASVQQSNGTRSEKASMPTTTFLNYPSLLYAVLGGGGILVAIGASIYRRSRRSDRLRGHTSKVE